MISPAHIELRPAPVGIAASPIPEVPNGIAEEILQSLRPADKCYILPAWLRDFENAGKKMQIRFAVKQVWRKDKWMYRVSRV